MQSLCVPLSGFMCNSNLTQHCFRIPPAISLVHYCVYLWAPRAIILSQTITERSSAALSLSNSLPLPSVCAGFSLIIHYTFLLLCLYLLFALVFVFTCCLLPFYFPSVNPPLSCCLALLPLLLSFPLSAQSSAVQLAWFSSGVVKYKYNKDVFELVNPFWAEKHHHRGRRCGTRSGIQRGWREGGEKKCLIWHGEGTAGALAALLLALPNCRTCY